MKLFTLNTHSLLEEHWQEKQQILIETLIKEQPDVVALQEVNQPLGAPPAAYVPKETISHGISLKEGNYALQIATALEEKGSGYTLIWVGMKQSYGKYEEGLCFLCKFRPQKTTAFSVSQTTNPTNWRKRMVLGVKSQTHWFYNVHFGRWDDTLDPFSHQWEEFENTVNPTEPMFVMGDFNAPRHLPAQGYSLVLSRGFYDTHTLASQKDEGQTAFGAIDGWQDNSPSAQLQTIDYIFTNRPIRVLTSKTLFTPKEGKVISDHFALTVTCQPKEE